MQDMRQLWQSDNITAYLEVIHKVLIRLQVWGQELEGYQRESKNEMSLRCLSIRGEREKKQTPCVYKISTNPGQRSKLSPIFSLLGTCVYIFLLWHFFHLTFFAFDILSLLDTCVYIFLLRHFFAFVIFGTWHFQSTGYMCLHFFASAFFCICNFLAVDIFNLLDIPVFTFSCFDISCLGRPTVTITSLTHCANADISEFP